MLSWKFWSSNVKLSFSGCLFPYQECEFLGHTLSLIQCKINYLHVWIIYLKRTSKEWKTMSFHPWPTRKINFATYRVSRNSQSCTIGNLLFHALSGSCGRNGTFSSLPNVVVMETTKPLRWRSQCPESYKDGGVFGFSGQGFNSLGIGMSVLFT